MLFVALALAGGFGLVLYAAYWLVLPLQYAPPGSGDRADRGARDLSGALGLVALVIGVLVLLPVLGLPAPSWITLPLLLVAVGVALVWRQSDEAQRSRLLADAGAGARAGAVAAVRDSWRRSLIGLGLVLLGAFVLLAGRGDLMAALRSFAAGFAIVGGVLIVLLPWMLSAIRGLTEERRARIRTEERAEVAAHVHDSVLQTLTLIQRSADDPREVARLARTEERALRTWLYRPVADADATLGGALARTVAEVEAAYDVEIDLVTVGDVPLDARTSALVQAAREAVVNAAKHAGGQVSVYVECGEGRVEVFVRDRGAGFDPEQVPADRLGWRESIVGRMARVGGTATLRLAPGGGTEVALDVRAPATEDA